MDHREQPDLYDRAADKEPGKPSLATAEVVREEDVEDGVPGHREGEEPEEGRGVLVLEPKAMRAAARGPQRTPRSRQQKPRR